VEKLKAQQPTTTQKLKNSDKKLILFVMPENGTNVN
jgi:hypothetical protein